MAGNILKTGKVITKTAERMTINATNGDIILRAAKSIKYSAQKAIIYDSFTLSKKEEGSVLKVIQVTGPKAVEIGKTYSFKATLFSEAIKDPKVLEDVKWAYQLDDEGIKDFPNPKGRVIGKSVVKKVTVSDDVWDNKKATIYAYFEDKEGEGKFETKMKVAGKAIIIAFPEDDPKIPKNKELYRWFEEKFGDGDHRVNNAGHAGIIIVNMTELEDHPKGRTKYFDFGRYNNRKAELGHRKDNDKEVEGIVRSSNRCGKKFGIPDWDFKLEKEQNIRLMMNDLIQEGIFTGYGKMIGAIAHDLDFLKMLEYAISMEEEGFIPFGGYFSSTDEDNATYCAKFVRGVAKAGGMDWDFNTFSGKGNVNDVIETYGGEIIELKNK